MKKEIAHLFWHGELTKLEKVCVQSLVSQGFDTKIWSYNNIQIEGAESCDARLVLPEENLTKYKQRHFKINDGTKDFYSSMAAFSDAFRWNVVNKFGGWWFDTDAYCLKSSAEFTKLRENKPLVAGLQDHVCPSVNSGIFYADYNTSLKLVQQLDQLCTAYNYNFPDWGMIGPLLISDVIQSNDLQECVISTENFYSIEYNQFNNFVAPELRELSKTYITNSYVSHIWHSQLGLHNIDKNNPPDGSLLKEFYDGIYTNNTIENFEVISKYKVSLARYIEVSKLYKKILDRPGDVVGIGDHVKSNLSYNQIEQVMINSEEYKRPKLYNLYRDILKREPDVAGLNHYAYSEFSLDEIRNIFLNSEEYKNLTSNNN
jgi:hypothetical protein